MSRVRLYLFVATAALSLVHAAPSFAQFGGGPGGRGGAGGPSDQDAQDEAKKRKRDAEFGNVNAPLPSLKNAGPCPFVKVLYDASRYLEFKNNVEASAEALYTGEIENIGSTCAYRGVEPIRVKMQILFELGRGPEAADTHKTYHYWVAVTDRNHAVLEKAYFDLPVDFPKGEDRVAITDTLSGVAIPRADSKVSGANFEILVGFDVTEQMAAFNRDGKRFRANAGQVLAAKP